MYIIRDILQLKFGRFRGAKALLQESERLWPATGKP